MSERGREVTVRLPAARPLIGAAAAAAMIAAVIVASVRSYDLSSSRTRLEHQLSSVEHQLSSFEQGALRTARDYAVTFATYRYDNLDAAFAATEAHSVDPFLTQYRSTTAQLRASLTASHASSSAKVISAGLASISSTQAVVVLLLDQTIVNAKGSRVDPQRVEMTMVFRDGRWLISKVLLP